MFVFTPNTVVRAAEVNANFGELTAALPAYNTCNIAWIAPTLTSSWANYHADYNSAGYWKDALGFVHLKGLLNLGTIGASMFTLPTGYRPAKRELFIAATSSNSYGRCDVLADGTVVPVAGSNSWFSLDGITFKAV